MPELQLQEGFTHDCNECQGLCCVAFEIRKDENFPEHKEEGVPCPQLNLDPQNQADLCKCKVFNALGKQGRKLCEGYTCMGAGNAVTKFLQELGIHWAMKPQDADNQEWELMRHNINNAFLFLDYVFYYLYQKHPDNNPARQPAKREMYEAMRKEAQKIANELALVLEDSSERISCDDWYNNKFKPAMLIATADANSAYILNKLGKLWYK